MTTPTLGMQIRYHPEPLDNFAQVGGAPLVGVIAYVWPDLKVNVGVLDVNGNHHNQVFVPFISAGDTPPTGRYCEPL